MHTRFTAAACLMMLMSFLCLSAGCQDNVRAPAAVRSDPLAGGYPQKVALNDLDHGIVAEEPIVDASTPDRPMRVTVPVRSVVEHPLNVQYRFTFLDDRGRPIRGETGGWRYVNIAPRVQVAVEASALDTNAADWRLELRPAR